MANINELNLGNEDLGLDYNSIPEERGDYIPPMQPGTYVFELPTDLSSVWETIERNGGTRVQAVLHNENALTAHLPGNTTRTFSAWINNHAYPRGGSDGIEVSDLTYLIRVLEPAATPRTNPQFVDVFGKQGGKKFKANVVWSAFCNPNKDAYFENKDGVVELVEGNKGCGENYYQKAIPRDESGMYVDTFKCTDGCNAVLKAFPKLRKFSSLEA